MSSYALLGAGVLWAQYAAGQYAKCRAAALGGGDAVP